MAILATTACVGPSKKNQNENTKTQSTKNYSGTLLTEVGENFSPTWSLDGELIFFVSRNRLQHKNAQVYSYSLLNREEKRITFSDGDTASPLSTGKDLLLYASTTDELKEYPLIFHERKSSNPPSEIYKSDFLGNEITRLTNRPGFDGSLSLSKKRDHEIYYISEVNEHKIINKLNTKTGVTGFILGDRIERRHFVSSQKNYAWIEIEPNSATPYQLLVALENLSQAKKIQLDALIIEDLDWINDDLLMFSASFKESPEKQIYVYDIKGNCRMPLVRVAGANLTEPKISPDLKKLLYVSTEVKGVQQVLLKNIELTELKCSPVVP